MKSIYFLCFLLFLQLSALHAKNYITIEPGSCPNCMAAIELMNKNDNVYIFQKSNRIDSSSLRHKYTFLHTGEMVFSDSLYQLYSTNGLMSVSNEQGTLKCPLPQYGRTTNKYFSKWNSDNDLDTIIYSFPLAKSSIRKRIFTADGKVYLLNGVENNVLVYDLFTDKMLDTIMLPEQAKRDAYYTFGGNDSNSYEYYKTLITPKIQDALCTLTDITVSGDTLNMYISNYFIFTGGEHGKDTFLTHFLSISAFTRGKYLSSFVPTNIKERVMDSTKKFFPEVSSLYKYKDDFYFNIYNSSFFKGLDKYAVGRYNPKEKTLNWVIKLTGDLSQSYDYSNPIFNENYCMISKSTQLYDIEKQGSFIDLGYFKQEFHNQGYSSVPRYYNSGFTIKNDICSVLYHDGREQKPYFAKIDLKTQKIVLNKYQSQMKPIGGLIDPYNSDYIIQFIDNYKIIRYKVLQ